MGTLPPRAMRPVSPSATGLLSSPITIVPGPIVMLMRPPALTVAPFSTRRMPLNPVSDEPTASLMKRLGSRSSSSSFTTGENTAAVEPSAKSDEVS